MGQHLDNKRKYYYVCRVMILCNDFIIAANCKLIFTSTASEHLVRVMYIHQTLSVIKVYLWLPLGSQYSTYQLSLWHYHRYIMNKSKVHICFETAVSSGDWRKINFVVRILIVLYIIRVNFEYKMVFVRAQLFNLIQQHRNLFKIK